jgi:hypothetical protein
VEGKKPGLARSLAGLKPTRQRTAMKFKGFMCRQCRTVFEANDPNCVAYESVLGGTARR